jgi:Zn-dependent oligopeptidase
VNALKRFHQELFNVQSLGTDARSTCEAFRMAMAEEAQDLREIAAQAASYPFLAAVKPWAELAEAMAKKDDGYLLNQLNTFKDSWLDAEEDLLTPLKQFLNGNQKTVYDEVRAFELRYGDEFADLPAEQVTPLRILLESDKPYAGGLIPQAKSAIAELQKQLGERLAAAKAKALEEISEQEARLKATADFQKLETSKQEQVLAATAAAKTDVEAASQPGRALLRVSRYRNDEVPKQLQRMAALVAPPDRPTPELIRVVPASALKVNCPLSQITNGQELQQWLDALRASAQAELDQGHRISL